MPTNLPPEYYDAEERYRAAVTPEEKAARLEELLSTIPKHKGTDHLRADLRRKTLGSAESVAQFGAQFTLFGQSIHYITDGHDKTVWLSGSGREQLFDLDEDPQECHDLASRPECARRLELGRDRLIEALGDREEGFVREGKLVAGRPVAPCLARLRPSAASRPGH